MIVLVKKDSEFGDLIAVLNINADDLIKHVKEMIQTTTGIHKATQCLLHRFDNGRVEQLWQLDGHGKVSSYCIKHGSTLVLRRKRKEYVLAKVFGCRTSNTEAFSRLKQCFDRKSGTMSITKQRVASAAARVAAKQRVAALALSESNTAAAAIGTLTTLR